MSSSRPLVGYQRRCAFLEFKGKESCDANRFFTHQMQRPQLTCINLPSIQIHLPQKVGRVVAAGEGRLENEKNEKRQKGALEEDGDVMLAAGRAKTEGTEETTGAKGKTERQAHKKTRDRKRENRSGKMDRLGMKKKYMKGNTKNKTCGRWRRMKN